MSITIDCVSKRFGATGVLENVSLKVERGELVALLGPSGSGKTTLLRLIGGLESPDAGRILFDGHDTLDWPIQERRVGFVFQHYALFRHMTVFDNVAFGLRALPRRQRPARDAIERRVNELLELVRLPDAGPRYPTQLSGGQQQRVALARALAIDPRVLLLDEPFGALDTKVRLELRRWLRQIHDETGYTTVFVTHDQEEALELADRVVVLNQGGIEQIDTPERIYEAPRSPFVFDFIGKSVRLAGVVRGGWFRATGSDGALYPAGDVPDGPAELLARPHDVDLVDAAHGVPARVLSVHRFAGRATLTLAIAGQRDSVDAEAPYDGAQHAVGAHVAIRPRVARVFRA